MLFSLMAFKMLIFIELFKLNFTGVIDDTLHYIELKDWKPTSITVERKNGTAFNSKNAMVFYRPQQIYEYKIMY